MRPPARTVRTLALVMLAALLAGACGARLDPNVRKQAAAAALNAGGSGTAGSGATGDNSGVPGAVTGDQGSSGALSGGTATTGPGATQGGSAQGSGSGSGSSGCAGGATDTGMTANSVVLGNVSSTTGPVSGLFEGAMEGAQAFAAYANSIGGLCGHSVRIQFADDGTNCQNNQNSTEELAGKVFAFVGSFSLYDGCGGKYFAAHTQVPDIHVALAPEAETPPNHFDVETGELGYATGMFAYYANKYGAKVKNVGTLYPNVGGAVPKQQAIRHAAEHEGWKFVYSRAADATESDWTGDFVKMCQQKHIDIFFAPAENAAYAAKMVNDESQAGCPKSLINIIPIAYDQAFVQDVGNTQTIEGLQGYNEYSLFFNADEGARIPELKLFQQWFARTWPGKPANLYALFAWASGRLFQQAFEKAGTHVNRASLISELQKIKSFNANGIMAPVDPTAKHGGVKCYILWQFHNGKFERIDDPATGYRCDGEFLPVNG
jgi:ABC-type branched-subunit amino acid transport system substrate-binding protein